MPIPNLKWESNNWHDNYDDDPYNNDLYDDNEANDVQQNEDDILKKTEKQVKKAMEDFEGKVPISSSCLKQSKIFRTYLKEQFVQKWNQQLERMQNWKMGPEASTVDALEAKMNITSASVLLVFAVIFLALFARLTVDVNRLTKKRKETKGMFSHFNV